MAIKNVQRIDEAVLAQYLAQQGISDAGMPEERAARLEAHYRQVAPTELAECACGGISAEWEPVCPFCGDAEMEPAPDEEEFPPESEMALVEEPAQEPKSLEGIVMPVVGWQDIVALMRQAAQRAAEGVYDMGLLLMRVHDEKLWEKCRRPDGDPAYRTFKQAVQREFGLGHTYAYELMDVVKRFGREQVRQMGATKLGLVLKAPPDRQAEMEEAARTGASKRDLARKLAEIKNRQLALPSGAEAKVTVALMLTRQVLPAYAVPVANAEPKRAQKFVDGVWADLDLDNEVRLRVQLAVDGDGSLAFVVEARRLTGAEVEAAGQSA